MYNSQQWRMVSNTPTRLIFSGVVPYYLAYLHQLFANMPSLSTIKQANIKIQTNIAKQNSYTTNYAPKTSTAGTANVVTSIDVNQTVGRTNPFMVSNCGEANADGTSNFGLTVHPSNTSAFSVKLTSQIGALHDGTSANMIQSMLVVPTANMTPEYANKIMANPTYSILYNDFQLFPINAVAAGARFSQSFNGELQRARTMYVIPFLSAVSGSNVISPYTSPVSSAPTTCTPNRIKDMYLKVGNVSIFPQAMNLTYDFYLQNVVENYGKMNGNSLKSAFKSGLISKDMWERCYNVYVFNLEMVASEVFDDKIRLFGI
jgi:hypothetical protein